MATTGLPAKLTLAEFIEWEKAQIGRNEFLRGEVFAMVGGRRSHGCVVANLTGEIRQASKGSPCRVFSAGMELQIADDTILYPDVFVTCDAFDLQTPQIFRAPVLVAEVLTPSTRTHDRSRKFTLYRQLLSLREYVLIDPETRVVQAFRRNAKAEWVHHDMSEGATLDLPCIETLIAMDEVFAGVDSAE